MSGVTQAVREMASNIEVMFREDVHERPGQLCFSEPVEHPDAPEQEEFLPMSMGGGRRMPARRLFFRQWRVTASAPPATMWRIEWGWFGSGPANARAKFVQVDACEHDDLFECLKRLNAWRDSAVSPP
jgi:hypothetical protein